MFTWNSDIMVVYLYYPVKLSNDYFNLCYWSLYCWRV